MRTFHPAGAAGAALRSVLLAALLLVVASCGADTGETAASGSDSASAPATDEANEAGEAASASGPADEREDDGEAADAYPVTVEHARGSTTFESRPERIVTLNVQWTDAVLAMGTTPIAYVLSEGSGETDIYPWQDGLLDDATRIDTAGEIPLEQIAALEPDLILVTFLAADDAAFESLEQIAPTIGFVTDRQVDPWEEQMHTIGQILGQPDEAAEVVAGVEDGIAELAAELPELAGATYTLANYVPGTGIYVIADPEDGASKLFYGLGMEIDPEILALDTEAVGRVQISAEEIQLLDADLVGILLNGVDPATIVGYDQLGAVQNDTLISFELADIVGLNTPTPISVPYLVELIRPTLETVAGR